MKNKLNKKIILLSFILLQLVCFTFLGAKISTTSPLIVKAIENNSTTKEFLSNKTEAECIEYILDHGVKIPKELAQQPKIGEIVKNIIIEVENNPNVEIFYNYGIMQEFAENIKSVVLDYHKIEEKTLSSLYEITTSTLPNNTLYGDWQDDYLFYNCYSYAIDYVEGDYELDRYRYPGQMSNGLFSLDLTIEQMAELVRNDLKAIGHNDVYITKTRPSLLLENEKLICIRKGDTDYHFMKYHQNGGFWTHKPGSTAVLKYNYQPSNDVIWYGESIDKLGKATVNNSIKYTSEIYYIIYDWNGFLINNEMIIDYYCPINFDGYVELPSVTAIGDSAFANQTQITSVTLPNTITSIGNNAFEGCSNLTYVNIPSGVTSIGENAFGGCSNLNLSVSSGNTNYCVEDGVLYNKEKTVLLQACNIPENYVIPSSVTQIAPYAFSGNTKLTSLQIDGNITSIGNNAFENCVNLQSVRFTSSNPPIFGNNLFLNDNTIIYVPYSTQNAYKLALPTYANNITSKEFFINLISNGTIVETKVVYDGEYISELPELTLIGYSFGGWYDNTDFEGTSYNDGDLIQADTTFNLYAKWNPNQYTITLDTNGGTLSGSNQITVYYGLPYTTESIVEKTGYKFLGWYDNSGENGGSCYITSEGNGTTTWNMTNNLTLYARWVVEFYEIQIIGNGTITWLGASGLQSEQCSIPYGTVLNAINLIYEFKNSDAGYIEGHIFDHFNLGNEVINLNTIEDLGDDGDIITITPIWIKETHTIHFNLQSTGSIESITMEFGEPISLPIPIRDCYTFIGWKESLDDTGYVNWTTMQDLTLNEQNNGSVMLYADWEINTYTIVFHSNNGTEEEFSYSCVCNQQIELPTQPFNRLGYNIKGWARSESGEVEFIDGEEVENVTTVDNDIVHLYAIWQANVYNITYKNLTSEMMVFVNTYTYGIGLAEMPKVYLPGGYSPTEMSRFLGWYTDINFTNEVTSISATSIGDITLYGKYNYLVSTTYATGPYTIETRYEDEPIFELYINLKSLNYERFKDTTLSKIYIGIKFNYYEEQDGYQQFYLYNGSTLIDNEEIDLSNDLDAKAGARAIFDPLNIEDYKDVDILTVKFGATGFWGNDWVISNIEINVYFTNEL